MKLADLSSNPQLAALTELLSSISHASDPREVLQSLVPGSCQSSESSGRAYAEISTENQPPGYYVFRKFRSDRGTDLIPAVRLDGAPAPHDGIIAQLIRTPVPKIARELELSADPVLPAEMGDYRSAMAVPIFIGQAASDWIILFDRESHGFEPVELAETLLRTSLAGAMLGNLQIAKRLFDANIRVQREISDIAAIQQALLPESVPQVPGVELAASYETANSAGGDIYDIFPIGDGDRWVLFIGDVAGHGPAAAVVMAMLNCLLHTAPAEADTPARLMSHLNEHLCRRRVGGSFVTAMLGIFDSSTRELKYCSAGHPPPILFGADGGMALLEGGACPPLGLAPTIEFNGAARRLDRGDLLLLYTDGITEARNGQNRQFDVEGMAAAVRGGERSPGEALTRIRHALAEHSGRSDPEDDQTMVGMRCAG